MKERLQLMGRLLRTRTGRGMRSLGSGIEKVETEILLAGDPKILLIHSVEVLRGIELSSMLFSVTLLCGFIWLVVDEYITPQYEPIFYHQVVWQG